MVKDESDEFDDGSRPPQPPSGVEVTDFEAAEATLAWKAPADDGGLALTGYFVDYRKHRKEEEYPEKIRPAKRPSANVKGLETGCKYEFRVRAVNRAGSSDPSEPTPPQMIKAQRAPPKIDRGKMGTDGSVKCRVNQQLVLDVSVEGAPPPKTTWTRGDEEVKSDEARQVRVSHGPNAAKLVMARAERTLAGKYTLTAENQYGKDECCVDVVIASRPSVPGGPLEVTDITKKSCTLRWKAPTDNGGMPVSGYEVEKLDPYIDQWIPAGSTKDTSFSVRNLGGGKSYRFRVRACNKEGDSEALETEEEVVARNATNPPSQPGRPEACDWGRDFVELRWNTPEDDGGAEISSYRVEVKNSDRRSWEAACASEESDATVGSEHIAEGAEYQFRVVAVNSAGESDHSRASEPVTAKPRFAKPKIGRDNEQQAVSVHCSQPLRLSADVSGEPRPKSTWWSPTGAKLEDNGEDVAVSDDGERVSLTIRNLAPTDSGGYKLKAKNSEGSDELEFKVSVVGPPGKPQGPLEISDVGRSGCRLSWRRPESDGGSQIKSYQVEKRRVEQEEWVIAGTVAGQVAAVMKELDYEVTNLLEGEVYMFRVLAVSAQGDGQPLESFAPTCAGPSRPVPDRPAGQPRIKDCDKKWAVLEWSSPSDGAEVTHYIVEKWEQFKVPKLDEPEEQQQQGEGDDGEEPTKGRKMSDKARPQLGGPSGFSGEFQEYCSSWMMALKTEDAETKAKIADLAEGHTYKFRIRAANASGASDPSEPSQEIVCRGKQRPVIDRNSTPKSVGVSVGETVVIQVKFTGDPVPDRTWHFGRAVLSDALPSAVVADKNHSSKLTISGAAKEKHAGRYEFRVSNEFGQETALVDLVVRVAPDKPGGPLRIDDVSAEGCRCQWKEPEDDGGSPVTHYVLEKATKSTGWIQCGRTAETFFKVGGLAAEKEHRIRVKAVNAEGESEPLVCVEGFVPENSFGAPTAPGQPEMVDGDHDHFVVAWDPPRNDGGSAVTGYQLETRRWKETAYFAAGEVRMPTCKGEARGAGIELGGSYAVRVRAVNGAGAGPWSMESERLTARHRAMKPRVEVAGPKNVTVKAGESLEVTVTVEAQPPPEEIAFVAADGTQLMGDGANVRIEISKDKEKAKLKIDKADRKLSGTLTCTASNRHGQGSSSVDVCVQSPPTAPQGILEVSEVSKTGCRLQWQRSADDGGLDTHYVVEKREAGGGGGQQWERHAKTLSTQVSVQGLSPSAEGAAVDFRVRAVNSAGESEPLAASRKVELKDNFSPPLPPGACEVTDWSENRMDLEWSEPLDCCGAPVTAYHVEARLNGAADWQLWEVCPATSGTKATLQMLNAGTEYQFRVRAVNKAGKSEPSHPSQAKSARAKNLAPSLDARFVRDFKAVAGDRIKVELTFAGEPTPTITWTKDDDLEGGGKVSEVASNKREEVTVTVGENSTKLALNSVTKKQEGRYTVTAENANGSDSASFCVAVRDRPSPPAFVAARAPAAATADGGDTAAACGVAALTWKRPEQDGGSPIDYYQVERFDSARGSWLACGRSKATDFEARGLIPGHEYRFRVSAVNRQGESDPAETADVFLVKDTNEDGLVRAT